MTKKVIQMSNTNLYHGGRQRDAFIFISIIAEKP